MPVTIQMRRGTASDWAVKNPVLKSGELGYELGTARYKVGDGFRRWSDLPYFIDQTATETYVDSKVAELQATVSGVSEQDLLDHINSTNPHPAYDDGPSFVVLYENAKV